MGFARVGSNPTVVDDFLGMDSTLRLPVRPCGAMDSASDFGSGGWGFESPQGLNVLLFFCWFFVYSVVDTVPTWIVVVSQSQVWPSG